MVNIKQLLVCSTVICLVVISDAVSAEFSIDREESGDVAIYIDGKLFTRYVTSDEATNKCYFWPVIGSLISQIRQTVGTS